MDEPDFKNLSLSIQRCNAVYTMDENARMEAFKALGSEILGAISTVRHQAVLHRPPNGPLTLTVCGSRVTEGSMRDHLHDLATDAEAWSFDIGGGRKVAKGAYQDAAGIYKWLRTMAPTEDLVIEGHSLGGWIATYASEYVDRARILAIYAWESPLQGNDAYWEDLDRTGLLSRLINVYHGEDPWALWPWENSELNKGRDYILWIKSGTEWKWVLDDELPVADLFDLYHLQNSVDHGPESVVADVAMLAK